MNTQIDIQQLKQSPVFQNIGEERLENFLNDAPHSLKSYNKQDLIVMQGERCRSLYMLYSGKVQAVMTHPDGKELVVEVLEAPVAVAPILLFGSKDKFPVSLIAVSAVEIIVINKDKFLRWMQEDVQLMQNFLRIISDRSVWLTEKINSFALQSLEMRLAHYLFFHSESPESQSDIAKRLGVARPSLSRVVSGLVDKGVITIEKRKIIVSDSDKLKDIMHGG